MTFSRFHFVVYTSLICLAVACLTTTVQAELKLASVFGDNMVLQRDKDLNIWGWADANQEVTVELREQSVSTKSDADGKWLVKLNPISLGEPFDVSVVSGEDSIKISNCLAGEVWICSGQSNMEWTVNNSGNPKEEKANANYPLIRHMKVVNTTAYTPRETATTTGWSVCSPETVGNYTAVGYYFARKLHKELDVPVGLINTSWGGTIVETWISGESLKTLPDFASRVDEIVALEKDPELAKKNAKASERFNQLLQEAFKDRSEDETAKTGDVSSWNTVSLPHQWPDGKNDVDGIGWYRRSVTIPKSWVGKELSLSLAKIDDADETYVNGKLVGKTDSWDADRRYKISADMVTKKDLTIAVRVMDGHLGGGIHGEAENVSISAEGEKSIPIASDWSFKLTDKTIEAGPRPKTGMSGPNHPTLLYNAMVKPLVPVTFRGAIWYQGESNTGRAYQYRTLFPLLIQDWRKQFDQQFPFYWVQLANFMDANDAPTTSNWAELREAQSMTLSVPNTGQAVIIDIGEAKDIHPKNKQDVGKRLALIALSNDYRKDIVFSGPAYQDFEVSGNSIVVSFIHADGLMAKGSNDGALKRFEIAGTDKKFVFANAKVVGETVVVSHPDVPDPVAVRYAWSHNPEGCNLYNEAGLPASPFRTDTWPGVTDNNK